MTAAASQPSSLPPTHQSRHKQAIRSPWLDFCDRLTTQRQDLTKRLSRAELLVLPLLLCGGSELEVARRLHRSIHTVRDHTKVIYRKLNVTNRVHLVLLFCMPTQAEDLAA